MSYIRAKKVEDVQGYGRLIIPDVDLEERPSLDMNLDDEILDFVLGLIHEVNSLREGEALVVWKEIF